MLLRSQGTVLVQVYPEVCLGGLQHATIILIIIVHLHQYNIIPNRHRQMNVITLLPYIVILLANLLYLYMHNYQQQLDLSKVFLYNLAIMIFSGIFITIHVNILLHKWLVEESDKHTKGQGKPTKKQIIQRKVKELLQYKYMAENLFIPGNQIFLIKVYLGMAVFRWLISLLPGLLVTLLFALYYQYKGLIQARFGKYINIVNQYIKNVISYIVENMPKYRDTRVIASIPGNPNSYETNSNQNKSKIM